MFQLSTHMCTYSAYLEGIQVVWYLGLYQDRLITVCYVFWVYSKIPLYYCRLSGRMIASMQMAMACKQADNWTV